MKTTFAFFLVATILLYANARPADDGAKAAEAAKAAGETAIKAFGAGTPAATPAPAASPAPAAAPASAPAANPMAVFQETATKARSEFTHFAQSLFSDMQMG